MCREPRELGVYVPGEQMWTASRGLVRPKFEYTAIDNDAVDITVPVGCTQLSDPVQLPGYGGYKTIICAGGDRYFHVAYAQGTQYSRYVQ